MELENVVPGKLYSEDEIKELGVDFVLNNPYNSEPPVEDDVNAPSHYQNEGIETIDIIEAVQGKYHAAMHCQATVIKYITRVWDKEDPLKDARKCRWYLDRMIKNMEATKGINW